MLDQVLIMANSIAIGLGYIVLMFLVVYGVVFLWEVLRR